MKLKQNTSYGYISNYPWVCLISIWFIYEELANLWYCLENSEVSEWNQFFQTKISWEDKKIHHLK